MDGGAAWALLQAEIAQTVAAARSVPACAPWADRLATATQALQAATDAAWSSGNAQLALANATAYMTAFGHVTLAWLWLDIAVKAYAGMAASSA
jgi:butyryl-CoA dehydrogenase